MTVLSPQKQGVRWKVEIRDLVDGSFEDRLGAAFLHAALLPGSPVVKLGYPFMTKYYYYHLVRDGLIGCHLALVDGQPAGFVAYTVRPHDFMLTGLRRHLLTLLPIVTEALVTRFSRVAVVGRTLGMLKRRRDDLASGPVYDAEILSLAVLPQYRSSRFVRETGQHLSRMLWELAVERTRQAGAHTLVMCAEARDHETLMFLHSMGCEFHREWLDGADCFEVTHKIT